MDDKPPTLLHDQAGGGPSADFAGDVVRRADHGFFAHLKAGEVCLVFNSRQMGTSSLRVRGRQRLNAEEVRCAVSDAQARGHTTPAALQVHARHLVQRLIGA